ncbi:MAG: hypothetical protein O3B76_01410 [Proteobacteria bacterium]|nr:hypothetical protein [Pseudomonadota bacterium]MDA1022268.1 hypothetical protein [Pseudomonadota bacterium]
MGQFAALAATTALQQIQARQQAKAQNAAAQTAANFQTQQIGRAQEIRERQRRDLLGRNLATQRARFASRGIAGGGSVDALLRGLSKETDQAINDDRFSSDLRIGNINNTFENTRRRNLLELSDIRQRAAFNLLGKGLNGLNLLK